MMCWYSWRREKLNSPLPSMIVARKARHEKSCSSKYPLLSTSKKIKLHVSKLKFIYFVYMLVKHCVVEGSDWSDTCCII